MESPSRKIEFREKTVWTIMTLLIFLVLSQVPLYGIRASSSSDPLYWLRVLTASNRETLMELGISPIVTSDESNKEEQMLFQGLQKLIGLLITGFQAIMYVKSGIYGDTKSLGMGNSILIVLQLFVTGVIVILLDEMLQKGYGIGSGISLFIAANICETIVWKSLSPTKIVTDRGAEYEGAITAFFHLMLTHENKLEALRLSFYRSGLPNMLNLLATVGIFVVIIYFQGFRVELPIKNERVRAVTNKFYTSNTPIILQTALVSNMYFVSKLLYHAFPNSFLVRLIGVWKTEESSQYEAPVWGLAFFLSPPAGLKAMLFNPLHMVFYFSFVLGTAAIFSRAWIDISGSSSKDVARQFSKENIVIVGYRRNTTMKVLDRYIPIAAAFGGMCIGGLTIIADYMGAIGSGTGILLVVTIIFQYFEVYAKEVQKEGGSFLSMMRASG